tara:strand:+ start:23404 stop:23895 length:492 start_codon:yes stop_codon:yes gene_type:complete
VKKRIEFPLFELTAISILLSVLLIFALPKFVDVGREARIKTLNAVAQNLDAVNRLMYSRAVIKNVQNVPLQHSAVLGGEDADVYLVYGELRAEQNDLSNIGISPLISFEKTNQSEEIRLYLKNYQNEGCYINYHQASLVDDVNTPTVSPAIKKAHYDIQHVDC